MTVKLSHILALAIEKVAERSEQFSCIAIRQAHSDLTGDYAGLTNILTRDMQGAESVVKQYKNHPVGQIMQTCLDMGLEVWGDSYSDFSDQNAYQRRRLKQARIIWLTWLHMLAVEQGV